MDQVWVQKLFLARICSDHFKPECFVEKCQHLLIIGREPVMGLIKTAMPTEKVIVQQKKHKGTSKYALEFIFNIYFIIQNQTNILGKESFSYNHIYD